MARSRATNRRPPCATRSVCRPAARDGYRPGAAARGDGEAPVRALALQRPPALLRLHHLVAGADRHARRPPGRGGERERRRLDAVAVATEIELQTVRWIAELIGYPTTCGGLLVSGGNMANIVCFLAAARRSSWDVRAEGLAGRAGRRLRVYASAETHTWIQKATDLSGLGTDAIRWIPTDDALRMDVQRCSDSSRQIARGDLPFMVVGTAGSVSTGAVDPLREIARFAGTHGSGSMSTARTAASRRRRRMRRMTSAHWPRRLRRRGPAQVALRAARGRLRARARPGRCGPPSRTIRRTTTSASRRELRRLRSAELARLPGAQSVAGATAGRRSRLRAMIGDDIALAASGRRGAAHPELELTQA